MYVAVRNGAVVVARVQRLPQSPSSSTHPSQQQHQASILPASASCTPPAADNDECTRIYAPSLPCIGAATHEGGRYAAFACPPDDVEGTEALGLLVTAYLRSSSSSTHGIGGSTSSLDVLQHFVRRHVPLEAVRVHDGDLLLGSTGNGGKSLLLVHLRHGRIGAIQEIPCVHSGEGGSLLIGTSPKLKGLLDDVVLKGLDCGLNEEDLTGFCDRIISLFAAGHEEATPCSVLIQTRAWYHAVMVIQPKDISFAERFWEKTTSGCRKTMLSLPMCAPALLEGTQDVDYIILASLPCDTEDVRVVHTPDNTNTAAEKSPTSYTSLSRHKSGYSSFVRQEANHVSAMEETTAWKNTSEIWSLRWAIMSPEERHLYCLEADADHTKKASDRATKNKKMK